MNHYQLKRPAAGKELDVLLAYQMPSLPAVLLMVFSAFFHCCISPCFCHIDLLFWFVTLFYFSECFDLDMKNSSKVTDFYISSVTFIGIISNNRAGSKKTNNKAKKQTKIGKLKKMKQNSIVI